MKNLYVFLHGNPGSKEDFATLVKLLNIKQTDAVIHGERPQAGASVTQLIEKGSEYRAWAATVRHLIGQYGNGSATFKVSQ